MVVKQEDSTVASEEIASTKSSLVNENDTNNNTIATATETKINGVTADDAATNANNNDSELILIQDNAFSIKIQVPAIEPFELQVLGFSLYI